MKIAVDIDDTLNTVDRVRYAGEYIRRKNLPFRLKDENAHAFAEVYDWAAEDVGSRRLRTHLRGRGRRRS